MSEDGKADGLKSTAPDSEINKPLPTVIDNRLETLTVLSNSLVKEIEVLRKGKTNVTPGKINLIEEVQRFEKELIRSALVRTSGNQRKAAKLLNVKISTLNAKIKRLGIDTTGLYQERETETP
jgi:transcriptional regulator with GAF, ATPase, and Fis domain